MKAHIESRKIGVPKNDNNAPVYPGCLIHEYGLSPGFNKVQI